jgi:hypothetical protein
MAGRLPNLGQPRHAGWSSVCQIHDRVGHRKFKGPGQRPRRAFDGLRRLDLAPVPSPRAVLAGPCTAHQGRWRSSPQGCPAPDGVAPKRRASPPRLRSCVAAQGRGVCDGRRGSVRGSGCEVLPRLARPPSGRWLRIQPCRPRPASGRALRQAQTVHWTVCVRAQPQVGEDLLDYRPPGHRGPGVRQA